MAFQQIISPKMSVITQVSLNDQVQSNPDLDKKAIAELKQWAALQSHLPELSSTDLAVFYLNNDHDLEATKSNVNNYFVMRYHMPEFFAKRMDLMSPQLQKIFDSVFIVTLPKRTKDNHKVILARLMNTDPASYDFENAVKVMNMIMDAGVYEDGPDNKYIFVFDLDGTTMAHRHTFSWMGLKKFYEYVRKGAPVKWISAHYTNTGIENNEFHQFVKMKVANGNFAESHMVQYHSEMDDLLIAAGMDRRMLPNEMGGDAGSALGLQKQQVKKLESLHAFFAALENKTKLTNVDSVPSALEIFGPERTF